MISLFECLPIDRELVCEFFATFARFEYALKATPPFCGFERDRAVPNWKCFGESVGADLAASDDPEVMDAIRYLVNNPPQVQKFAHGHPEFQPVALQGKNGGEKATEAAKRVRNNLFHGGKHTPHSPPERDEKLIRSALIILEACLKLRPDLRAEFEHFYA